MALPRLETGKFVFGKDWPGVFVRGDDAIGYATTLMKFLDAHPPDLDDLEDVSRYSRIQDLVKLLRSCSVKRRP